VQVFLLDKNYPKWDNTVWIIYCREGVMANPFFYGEEVAGEFFTDREAEVKDLIADLSRGQNVIVFSPRRYGKTSLIKKVLGILAAKGLLVFYVNLYAATSKRKFIEIYARAIAHGTKGKLEKVIEQLKALLPALIPKIVISQPGVPEFEFDYGRKTKNLTPLLEDLYEAVEKHARKNKKRAVVVFDEFQEILNLEDDEIERSLREYVQSQKQVAYVFMGSKRHLMQELFDRENRPFYKSGRMFPLPKISPADFSIFIKEKFGADKIEISQECLANLLQITECHPYYTQMFCSILWDRNVDKKKITQESLLQAMEEAIAREAAKYSLIWDALSRKKKMILEALAKGGGENIYTQDFIADFSLGTPSNLQKGIKTLQTKEIIEKENGRLIFSDIFFKQWILSKITC